MRLRTPEIVALAVPTVLLLVAGGAIASLTLVALNDGLRLRWAAILHGHLKADIAVSGGVHTVEDIIKAIMCGANVVQVVSALLKYGPSHIGSLITGLRHWLDDHEYESVDQMRGSMSLRHCPDPSVFERANYLRVLQLWKV